MRLSNPLPLFMLMVVFSPLSIDIFLPAIPQMAEVFQVPVAGMQQSVPVFMFAFGLGQLVAGPLADRYGRRPVALTGACFYILASVSAALAGSFELLMLSRLGQGLAVCALSVSAFAGVRDHFGPEGSKTMFSYLNGLICIVPALAPLLGGALIHWWDWSASFWFMAGYGLVVVVCLFLMLSETRPKESGFHDRLLSYSRYRSVIQVPSFRFHSVLVMLGTAMIIGYISQSPTRLMVDLQLTSKHYAFWFGANAVINIVAAFFVPRWIKKTGQQRALWLGVSLMALAAIAELAGWAIVHPLSFMGPVFVASVGFCFVIAIGTGNALVPFGDKAGTASALLGLAQMTGSACLVGLLSISGLSAASQLAVLMALPFVWVLWHQLSNRARLQAPAISN